MAHSPARPASQSTRRRATFRLAILALVALVAVVSGTAMPASTGATVLDHGPAVRHVLETWIRPWLGSAVVIDALRKQNDDHRLLTQTDIETLDARWRAETLSVDQPLIDELLANELSRFLYDIQVQHHGLFTEIFVVDNRGLNVGQSGVTSDYWQGDEDKWQRTFLVGPDAIFIGGVEEDESTQQFQSQVSIAIADPQTGLAIGSITVGVDVDRALDLLP